MVNDNSPRDIARFWGHAGIAQGFAERVDGAWVVYLPREVTAAAIARAHVAMGSERFHFAELSLEDRIPSNHLFRNVRIYLE